MGEASFFVKSGADDLILVNDDRAHAGIGAGQSEPFSGKFNGQFHPAGIPILCVHGDLVSWIMEKGQ